MAEDDVQQHKLSDGDIRNYLETNDAILLETLIRLNHLVAETSGLEGSAKIPVSVELLRAMRQTMLSMYKTISDMSGVRGAADRGDLGEACDYNPFSGVNTGDLINVIVSASRTPR